MAGQSGEADDLVAGLKQLVLSCGPYLQDAGTAEAAEDAILHMEENDENFHRYDFVKQLRSKMEASLGKKIDEEIERHSIIPHGPTTGQETLVTRIVDEILSSKEFEELTTSLKTSVNSACDYLLRNFEKEFCDQSAVRASNSRQKSTDIFSDGESSLGDSSLNQSTFMFMNSEQFQQIAESLDKKKPLEIRREALQNLYQTPMMDVQNSDMWSRIRRGLLDAVCDQDEQLWTLALKFVARGFSSNNPCTKEMYSTLVEFLTTQFNVSNKGNIPKLKNGLDGQKVENIKLLKAFRLMNEFQHQCPQYWIRYPDRFLDEILESTLSLLAIHHSQAAGAPTHMTPGHYMALFDPKAHWFSRWMHGHYSRAPLLRMLSRHRAIIENAVKVCVEYTTARKVPFDLASDASETTPRDTGHQSQAIHYTGPELEYGYFVHSLLLLGKILCYKEGRGLFPVKIKDRDDPVTVTTLVVTFVNLLTAPASIVNIKSPAIQFDPGLLVTDIFKKICRNEISCRECLCKDSVTNVLLDPISHWLDDTVDATLAQISDMTLLQIAEIVSLIAASSAGRKHLLYGESQEKFTRSKSSPAHLLTEFAKKALANKLHSDHGPPPSKAVVGNFAYVCRHLYNTCEGLLVLSSSDLHTCIAEAWKEASREADLAATPTPSIDGDMSGARESQFMVLWEDTLRDNLLSFSSTPKGLLLLEQIGALPECVHYMYSRYVRRLQVSKCEKFGYGYMMSQVCATAPGMVALLETGYIRALTHHIWSALEVVDDTPVYIPRSWPVNPIDKTARKAFNNLASLLSSFPAVYEVLYDKSLPTKDSYTIREVPDSIQSLLDRIVLIDSNAKIQSLFNFEQSHLFGLRLLSVFISCLDTMLLLQTQYNFQDVLLAGQQENTLEGSTEIIVDMLSVERNYLLVKAYLVGGPSERTLPPRTLIEDQNNPFPYTLFSSYPVPREYMSNVHGRSAMKQASENDLSRYLSETKKAKLNVTWLEKCRKALCSVLTTKPEQAKGTILQDLLERSVQVVSTIQEDAIFPQLEFSGNDSSIKSFRLSSLQKEGVKVAVRYGLHLKLISSSGDAMDKLTHLLKQVGFYLQQQQRSSKNQTSLYLQKSSTGFDWFVATTFLLMNGNVDRAWKFLQKFSTISASAYLWLNRLHLSVHLPPSLTQSGIPPVFSSTSHNVELILQAEVTHVHSAFKMSGYTSAQICQHWIRQCFWNYLDWLEICHYLCICVLLGIDYQVYICVAILRFLQQDILQHMQEQDLIVFLKEQPIRGFRVGEHLEYMQQLERKFRKTILQDMRNVSKP